MAVIERYSKTPLEIWHDGVLIAVVYEDRILVNSSEDVEVIFGEPEEDSKAWMS